jgi:hypothetical protein
LNCTCPCFYHSPSLALGGPDPWYHPDTSAAVVDYNRKRKHLQVLYLLMFAILICTMVLSGMQYPYS